MKDDASNIQQDWLDPSTGGLGYGLTVKPELFDHDLWSIDGTACFSYTVLPACKVMRHERGFGAMLHALTRLMFYELITSSLDCSLECSLYIK